jgi:hypothetical protein
MRIGQLKAYIVKHYFSPRRSERRYGILVLGAPGVGKSMSVEEAGREIASKLQRQFLKVVVRWSSVKRKFVINTEGEHEIEEVLTNADKFFTFTDFRLSTVEPSDLSGIPRSKEGITYYDPLLWAVLHSTCPGILFLDELTWIQREDVWAITPQLVLDKVAGLTKFSEETLVIAAGNRPEDAGTLVRMIHNPLLNRFKIIRISPASIDEWADWMNSRYDDKWDRRVYAFLTRFKDEGYFLQVPNKPEGLEGFPSPRSWSWLALDLYEGFNTLEDLTGLVGEEVGRKLDAFMKITFDIDELIKEPAAFLNLNFDAKYMVPIMLANWIADHKDVAKAFPLIDSMSSEKHEFLVMTCLCMNKKALVTFLKSLFLYKTEYKDVLSDVALKIKDEIAA